MVLSWVVCAVAWGVLTLLDETTLPLGAPVVMLLANWFWSRHRYWVAGAAATCAGSAVALVLIDLARSHLDRIAADAWVVAAAATVALVVFAGASRLTTRAARSGLT
ncbi:hypothetical protein [Streptomyces adustus]|uniref:hypothetical protein n=1 Tax=Streptomyces adustus TaxID=1609272 RepID=UPI003723C7C9